MRAEARDDHAAGTDFGFSVWDAAERFLGSLYLNEPAGLFEDYPEAEDLHRALGVDVRVEYWLRRGTSIALEEALVVEAERWLHRCGFTCPVWGSRRPMTERRAFYEGLGLQPLAALGNRDQTRTFWLHGRVT